MNPKHPEPRMRAIVVYLFLISSVIAGQVAAAATENCFASFASPLLIPIAGSIGDVMIDDQCTYAYVTNTTNNRVEIVSLRNGSLGTPIDVGASPVGLDTSPDGSTLYVANSGGDNISVVDLAQGIETRKVPVPAGFSNDTPFSLAVANNGLVLFSTTFAGTGFGGRMMQWDPVSDTLTQRTDFWFNGTNTEITFLKASADRSVIGIVAGDISSGPVFHYLAASNSFTNEKDLNSFISYVALDQTGSTTLVDPGTYVLDTTLNLSGTIGGTAYGVAVDPSGTIGYRVSGSNIEVLDLSTFLPIKTLDLGDTVNQATVYSGMGIGRAAISRDGSLLAVITDHGLSIINTGNSISFPMASLTASMNQNVSAAANQNWLKLTADFTLSPDSDGIYPLSEPMSLQVGSFNPIIPAGSFQRNLGQFVFEGTVGTAYLKISLARQGASSYQLTAYGQGMNWAGTSMPPTLGIVIGNDRGSVTLNTGSTQFSN